MTVDHCNI